MTLTFDLSPELAGRIQAEAERRGVDFDAVILSALDRALPDREAIDPSANYDPDDPSSRKPITREEKLREIEAFERECDEVIGDAPILALDRLSREHIYADDGR